jgi:hypothetical protein
MKRAGGGLAPDAKREKQSVHTAGVPLILLPMRRVWGRSRSSFGRGAPGEGQCHKDAAYNQEANRQAQKA